MTDTRRKMLGDYYDEAYDKFFIYYEELVNNKENKHFDSSDDDDFIERIEESNRDAYAISDSYLDEYDDLDIVEMFKGGMSAIDIAEKTGRMQQYLAYYVSHWPYHLMRVASGKLDRKKSPQWAEFMDECLQDSRDAGIKLKFFITYAMILHAQYTTTGVYHHMRRNPND